MIENGLKEVGRSENTTSDVAGESGGQKKYEKPELIAYGDVRDVTLGPTLGEGESGNALIFRVPPP